MSDREKLAPGWRPSMTAPVFYNSVGALDVAGDADETWQVFELCTGITREEWEAMERAVELARELRAELGGRPLLDETGYVGQIDHKDCATVLELVLEADAILAALGEGVSDGE